MASHKSAAKRARQAIRRTARNTAGKSRAKSAVKAFRSQLAADGPDASQGALGEAVRLLQKAAAKGILHRRTAARRSGRLARAQHRARAAAAGQGS